MAASIIFALLSIILGFISYLALLKLLKRPISDKLTKMARFMVQSSLMLGLLGTYIGFYLGTKDGLTAESAVAALSTAVPTSIGGVMTFLIGSALSLYAGVEGESHV